MAGYTRNDTPNNIADGNVINASDLDGEFDAIENAFNGTTGHSHDGSSGAGPQIAAGGIASNAVTTAKILDANVTTAKIADNNVTTAKILDANVTTAKIAADAIDGTKIADDVINSEHYVAGSIDAEHLASDSVTTAKILDANVTTAKILDANVTTAKILDANVTTAKIAADAIDGTKIADDVIDSEHYVAGSIDGEHLAADIIDGTKIADDVIDSEHYVAGSIDAEHLASNSVTSAKLDTNIQVAGTLGVTGETTLTTHLNMGDGDIIKLGDDADLQIYHDGPESIISESGAGSLQLRGTNVEIKNAAGTETCATFITNDKVGLYYNNNEKLATTSTGIDVTGDANISGTLTMGGNVDLQDNDKVILGDGSDLEIYHDGSNSYIKDAGTGNLILESVTGDITFSGTSKVQQTKEKMTISATAATGTINYDALTQAVLYYTTDASANWTVNVRGDGSNTLNSIMSTGESLTVVFLVTQGSTAYYNSAFQVDGSSVTPKWQGGSAPSEGTASGIDSYTYTIIKTADATFTVLATIVDFS